MSSNLFSGKLPDKYNQYGENGIIPYLDNTSLFNLSITNQIFYKICKINILFRGKYQEEHRQLVLQLMKEAQLPRPEAMIDQAQLSEQEAQNTFIPCVQKFLKHVFDHNVPAPSVLCPSLSAAGIDIDAMRLCDSSDECVRFDIA